jgi:hypothetical protein
MRRRFDKLRRGDDDNESRVDYVREDVLEIFDDFDSDVDRHIDLEEIRSERYRRAEKSVRSGRVSRCCAEPDHENQASGSNQRSVLGKTSTDLRLLLTLRQRLNSTLRLRNVMLHNPFDILGGSPSNLDDFEGAVRSAGVLL